MDYTTIIEKNGELFYVSEHHLKWQLANGARFVRRTRTIDDEGVANRYQYLINLLVKAGCYSRREVIYIIREHIYLRNVNRESLDTGFIRRVLNDRKYYRHR